MCHCFSASAAPVIDRVPDRDVVISDGAVRTVIGRSSVLFVPGESVYVTCTATGIPDPTITWSRNGIELTDTGRARVLDGGVLLVTETEESEMYTCTASNEAGDDQETITLNRAGKE